MTSAFGLKQSINKIPSSINYFWRRRLTKLLIPSILVNIIGIVLALIEGQAVDLLYLIKINRWVLWLLICYLIFWICYKCVPNREGYRDITICTLIALLSIITYFLKSRIGVTWHTEVYGFIWGIVLANSRKWFVNKMSKNWNVNCILSCFFALILGLLYLKIKSVVFLGDYLLKIILGLAIVIFMLVVNVHVSLGNKISLYLGSVSFEVYLLHGNVFGFVESIRPDITSGLFILMSLIVTVLISTLVQQVSVSVINFIEIKLLPTDK